MIVILITCSGIKEAQKIARALVKERLCACVNILGNIKSLFRWQGKIDSAREILLIAKSKKEKFAKIAKRVRSLHSYEVPEIIALPVVAGEKEYLSWLGRSIK
ncbi:MAG: divalent-cation tolerance protein CutA [Candidatus Omnitrophica bacterium]|nr:divalent-cation tolerance protein CutA [Candidatus Omnitrophota bacterium]MDD5236732.1 divalent-cation tolerance protein CutA [Candidatus Omnitrophota bacterium]MDD5610293.1 divalent-cation tolerance protein CutA [Candidatus Omnitrophota bacterium]